jgi:tetratricopeptide repeat protein 21B
MLAKGKLICGEIDAALMYVAKVLQLDPKNEECNILSAMIELKNNNLGQSYHYIEAAMSEDFTIRENPLFMLFKG